MDTAIDFMKPQRLSWQEFWFSLALIYSTRGTCNRLRTATVIVNNDQFVSAGYNGSPPGAPHCDEVGHFMINGHCERTIHGEANAIIHADRALLEGASAYVLGSPCLRCANELAGAKIAEIHCLGKYTTALGGDDLQQLLQKTRTRIVYHSFDPGKLLERVVSILSSEGGALYKIS